MKQKIEFILYEFKPDLLFLAGICCGFLQYPLNLIPITAFFYVSILIKVLRFNNRFKDTDYEEIEIKGVKL